MDDDKTKDSDRQDTPGQTPGEQAEQSHPAPGETLQPLGREQGGPGKPDAKEGLGPAGLPPHQGGDENKAPDLDEAMQYSRSATYKTIDKEAEALGKKLNGFVDPFTAQIRFLIFAAAVSVHLCLILSLGWLFLDVVPCSGTGLVCAARHGVALIPALAVVLVMMVFWAAISARFPFLHNKVHHCLYEDLINTLKNDTHRYFGEYRARDTEDAALALLGLMKIRARNVEMYHTVWLMPLIMGLNQFRARVTRGLWVLAPPLILAALALAFYVGYRSAAAGGIGAFSAEMLDTVTADPVFAVFVALSVATAFLPLAVGDWIAGSLNEELKHVLDLKQYPFTDIKDTVLARYKELGDLTPADDGETTLQPQTFDVSAFIVNIFYKINWQLRKWETSRRF